MFFFIIFCFFVFFYVYKISGTRSRANTLSQAQADYETLQQCIDDLSDARVRQQQLIVDFLTSDPKKDFKSLSSSDELT